MRYFGPVLKDLFLLLPWAPDSFKCPGLEGSGFAGCRDSAGVLEQTCCNPNSS